MNKLFNYESSKIYDELFDNKRGVLIMADNSEIRNIGLGIFSAEVTARCVLNADYNDSYAILQIGKECEALIINGNELCSYAVSYTHLTLPTNREV